MLGKIYKKTGLLLLSAGLALNSQAQKLVRDISPSPDGKKIAFAYQGDIWTASKDGSGARRLTIHEGTESGPVWSPDGSAIAFSGSRHGNGDIFTIPANGGTSSRVTFYDAYDAVSDWTEDGNLLFSSSRHFIGNEKEPSIYTVPATGGSPERAFKVNGSQPSTSPSGRFVVFTKGYCRTSREDYRGPANLDVWIYDNENQSAQRLTKHLGNDFSPVWAGDDAVLFLSARTGRYNIHRLTIDANGKAKGSPEAITGFEGFGIRGFDVSADGKTVALTRADEAYTLDLPAGSPVKMDLDFPADYREDPYSFLTIRNQVKDYATSPNGKYIATVSRGEVFIREADSKKPTAVNVSKHAFRDDSPVWLNDSTLLFVSDRDGEKQIYQVTAAKDQEGLLHRALAFEYLKITPDGGNFDNPNLSPDRKKIIYSETKPDGSKATHIANIEAGKKLSGEKVLLEGWNAPEYVNWSPDGNWITYASEDLDFNNEVYVMPIDKSQEPVNVSMHPRSDYSPRWSPDGKKIAFISNRNNGDNDVWMVWLTKEDWDKTKQDIEYELEHKKDAPKKPVAPAKDSKKKKKKKDKKEEKEEKLTKVDTDGLYKRLVQLTNAPGDETSPVFGSKSQTIYFLARNNGKTTFNSVKWDKSENKNLAKLNGYAYGMSLAKDGKSLYLLENGSLKKMSTAGKGTGMSTTARMKHDKKAERDQMFEEAWQAIATGFYDPKMHGYDWATLKEQYKPLAINASTSADFRYVFNLMLGQLNASHMGMYASDKKHLNNERTPKLGAALNASNTVTHVIPNTPADRKQSKLEVGDKIVAIDGMPIGEDNIYQILNGYKANDRIQLSVNRKGKKTDIIIRPTSSLGNAIYNEWVEEKRRLTDKYSGGKLGYLHIRQMSWTSFEAFERDLTAATQGKEAVVIDVRNNGGGWITDYLMTVLSVRQHAYTIPRGATPDLKNHKQFANNYPYGERLPFAAWTKPSIALCNEKSYSNAEIFSHAYKHLGIGKLVGQPTFGAVISTGGMSLIDGALLRMPFRAWYTKATDINQENGPAVPDIIVENAPDSYSTGTDAQLERAVKELLK
ncbi:tricorn protease [Fulvitalea axinellae]|uniref:Tricorn protease homolog n=1 Tax=Fulvitalea axinellae TaxID=1182444 RepID=A0AAU9CH38_9BACT|nr:tricorn protease [Fulvitalea axinellae]